MDLEGRVALVTGSARRLGREIARSLAGAGAHIAVHHHASPEEAEDAAKELRGLGVRADVFQSDLGTVDGVNALFDAVEEQLDALHILVNNAAVFERKPVLEIRPDDWERVVGLNLRAPFFCAQRAARLMNRSGGGRIVNIADVGAFEAWPAYAHHCISKAGLVMMTRVLARALAPGILVNAVAPGPVLPPEEYSDEERREIAEKTVLGRLGAPEDVSEAVLYLLRADYVTGETLVVDGGKRLMT